MMTLYGSRSIQAGLSYVEVLVAIVMIAAMLVPAATSLQGAMAGAASSNDSTALHYRARGRLEELLAQPFSSLSAQAAGASTPSTFSDAAGTPDRRLVYVSGYDADNADGDDDPFTGVDPDLLWLRVEIEGTVNALQVLKVR